MRVLHVHSGNLYGGVERILETLAVHRQHCETMEPAFALSFDGRLAGSLRNAGVPLALLGAVRGRRFWEVHRARRLLSDVLQHTRPDVALVHSSWSQAIFGPTVCRAGLPLVRWLHAPESGAGILAWAANRTPLSLAICNSRYTCESTALFRGIRRVVCYAPMAFPQPAPDSRSRVRLELATRDDAVVVAIAARMEAWKGHERLIDALGARAADPRWHCWVIGGAQRPSEVEYVRVLRSQVERLGIAGRVSFLGEREDVSRLLAAADIYCQPNVAPEPFGLSYVEALAAGLPVVASRLGALPEIVDDSCGILVDGASTAAVADALSRLMNPATRLAMSTGARERASGFGDLGARLAGVAEALRRAAAPLDKGSVSTRI